jgi:hypothetical protein
MLAAGLCLPGHARPADVARALMAGPGFGVLFAALAQVPQAAGVLRTARHGGTSAFLLASHGADLAVVWVLTSLYPARDGPSARDRAAWAVRASQGLGLLVRGTSVGLVAMG